MPISSGSDRIRYALSNSDFYTVQQSIVDLDGEGEPWSKTAR